MYRSRQQRQSESARHYIDFSQSNPTLDAVVGLAASTLGFRFAMINILDSSTLYTLARSGFSKDFGFVHPRFPSNCHFVTGSNLVIGIGDSSRIDVALSPQEFETAAHMASFGVASYLGVPLRGREGVVVGTLCVLDVEPHTIDAYTRETLLGFATIVEDQLEAVRSSAIGGARRAAAELAHALEEGEIVPWFQPIVDMRTGRVVALEALARRLHPSGRVDSPGTFLNDCVDSDLVLDVDHSILEQALGHLRSWHRLHPSLVLNSNLSARHLGHGDRRRQLTEIVFAAGVRPQSVNFELTETAAHVDTERIADFVDDLRADGFGVQLDDIGIGYSSLQRLLELPVDGFKIDAAIARRLGTSAGDSMVRALVALARETGRTLAIEGIETWEQASLARRNGCWLAQGYLYSRPVPAHEVAGLLGTPMRIDPVLTAIKTG